MTITSAEASSSSTSSALPATATIPSTSSATTASKDLSVWSKEDLIAHIETLQASITKLTLPPKPWENKPPKTTATARKDKMSAPMPTVYPTRKLALLIAYHGIPYAGFAAQGPQCLQPTVEGEIMKVLKQTRMVKETDTWEDIEWSRSGRTDKGVSGAGQVVGVRLRSNVWPKNYAEDEFTDVDPEMEEEAQKVKKKPKKNTDEAKELNYPHILNSLLPPSIMVLAWSPLADSPPTLTPPLPQSISSSLTANDEGEASSSSTAWDARHSCLQRHYKYFLHLDEANDGLDIAKMREGCQLLLGEHDFRNFCKLDGSKQVTNYRRSILRCEINPLDDAADGFFGRDPTSASSTSFVLDLVGSAFLYNQVRHIVAVLLLIGQGHEDPSIIPWLLTQATKPVYDIANAVPLVLWQAAYSPGVLTWQYGNEGTAGVSDGDKESTEFSFRKMHRQMLDASYAAYLQSVTFAHFATALEDTIPHIPCQLPVGQRVQMGNKERMKGARMIMLGGGETKTKKYVPLVERARCDGWEEVNRKWNEGRGERRKLKKALGAGVSGVEDEE